MKYYVLISEGPRPVSEGPRPVSEGPRPVSEGPRPVSEGPGPKGGATVGQWGQTAPTGKRLWGQSYVFAPTENQQVLNEEYFNVLKKCHRQTKIGR